MSKRKDKSKTRENVKSYQKKTYTKQTPQHTKDARAKKLSAARMVANAVSMGFMGIEKKFRDFARSETAIGSAAALTGGEYDPSATSGGGGADGGCVGCLSCPPQGDTEQSRDGKRITINSFILKGYVCKADTASLAAADTSKVFIAVVLDTQTNGAQLNSEDVFKNMTNITDLAVNPTKNLLFGSRFRILKSHLFDVTPIGVASAGLLAFNEVRRDFDWYIPFKGGLSVNLNAGTTADVANVIDDSLHIIAFSTDSTTLIAYNARIRFEG